MDIIEKKPSSPKKDVVFTKYWNLFIEDVTGRENFKPGHLQQLEILCDLYQEYNDLTQIIKSEGFTFESLGRYGNQIRVRPEVSQKNKVTSEIRQYSKILGITLAPDTVVAEGEEDDDWD